MYLGYHRQSDQTLALRQKTNKVEEINYRNKQKYIPLCIRPTH